MGKCIPLFVNTSKTSGVLCISQLCVVVGTVVFFVRPKKGNLKTSIAFNVSVQVSRCGKKKKKGQLQKSQGWVEIGPLVSQWSPKVGWAAW